MRWSDMDALGHVHNVRFMEYYEAARTDLIHRLLERGEDWQGVGMVVRRHEVDYLLPLIYRPRPVAVDTWVARLGTSSITIAYEVVEDDRSVIYGRGQTVMVTIDRTTGQPVPMPESARAALAEYMLEEGAAMQDAAVQEAAQPEGSTTQ